MKATLVILSEQICIGLFCKNLHKESRPNQTANSSRNSSEDRTCLCPRNPWLRDLVSMPPSLLRRHPWSFQCLFESLAVLNRSMLKARNNTNSNRLLLNFQTPN